MLQFQPSISTLPPPFSSCSKIHDRLIFWYRLTHGRGNCLCYYCKYIMVNRWWLLAYRCMCAYRRILWCSSYPMVSVMMYNRERLRTRIALLSVATCTSWCVQNLSTTAVVTIAPLPCCSHAPTAPTCRCGWRTRICICGRNSTRNCSKYFTVTVRNC